MLNIGKLAAGGEDYYLSTVASGVEDYYTGAGEAPGYWTGAATSALGLEGPEHFELLAKQCIAGNVRSTSTARSDWKKCLRRCRTSAKAMLLARWSSTSPETLASPTMIRTALWRSHRLVAAASKRGRPSWSRATPDCGKEVRPAATLTPSWVDQYAFTTEPHHAIDYALYNYNASHNPSSPFVRGLVAQANRGAVRYRLQETELQTIAPASREPSQRRQLRVGEVPGVLESWFDIDLGDEERQTLLTRLSAR